MATIKYKERFNKNFFEITAWQQKKLILGIDEAGRGCMAGPLVCGAAILHPQAHHPLLKDSKLLTPQEREKAFAWITRHAWYQYTVIAPHIIDTHNIYQATLKGMERAYTQLVTQVKQPIYQVLVDAMPLSLKGPDSPDVIYFNHAEQKSTSVAAASIVAKVMRDAIMQAIDPLFPSYALASHKGYCTAAHRLLVANHGPSLTHRTSYLKPQMFAAGITDQLSLITLENNEEIKNESIR
ncbi:MAG: ribonuclease HII [Candidatus Babeliales bacterium]